MARSPYLHPYAKPAAEADAYVTIVRGEGALVWDDQGNRYVDAVAAQMRTLENFHTFDRFTNEPTERLAAVLSGLAPMEDARVFLTCSGSEAVDSAIKLARIAMVLRGEPGRRVIVSRTNAYHGVTYGGLSAQGLPLNQHGFGPLLPDVVTLPHDDLGAAEDLFAERGGEVAAVLAEPVIGAGGVHPPAPGYLEGLRRLCDEHRALLVLDEVICGFGRLGAWWAAQHYGVRPDMVTFAKGVTSGYQPLGGVLVGPAVRQPLESDPGFVLRHGHTYSGHPSAAAAALVNLDILRDEGLLERAKHVGQRLSTGLAALVDDGTLGGVRGDGAVWAAVMPEGCNANDVREALLRRGVIARPLGDTAIAFCPPLVIDDADLDQIVESLADAVTQLGD